MADGSVINNQGAVGDKIDTEDLGTRGKIQRIKLALGDVDTDGGNVKSGNALPVTLDSLIAGEDLVNNVQKVEQRYSYKMVSADTVIASGAGFLHTITIACNDSAPTAGNLDVYDNTTNSGTKIFSMAFTTTYFLPVTIHIDASFTIGLYADFTTTADVNVTFSYR